MPLSLSSIIPLSRREVRDGNGVLRGEQFAGADDAVDQDVRRRGWRLRIAAADHLDRRLRSLFAEESGSVAAAAEEPAPSGAIQLRGTQERRLSLGNERFMGQI